MILRIAIAFLFFASVCNAQETAKKETEKTKPTQELRSELKAFQPFIGTWVFDGKFKDGRPLWAKNKYTVGMAGNFVMATTYAKDENNNEFQQYMTIWRWDNQKKKVVSHGFARTGSYEESVVEINMTDDGKPEIITITGKKGSPVAVEHRIKLVDEKSFSWRVATTATKDAVVIEGFWEKQE